MTEKETLDGNKTLSGVLAQGQEKARQLRAQLEEQPFQQLNYDLFISLANNIHQSFETAISMVKHPDLTYSGSDSPHSDHNSGSMMKDQSDMCKKRKSMAKWSSQVTVAGCLSGAGMDQGPFVDDGFSWRKYGQKDILGAKYPRSYYRCTHRITQGCLATKQVQRSGSDPTIFDVSYRGLHTCIVTDTPYKATESQQTINLTHDVKAIEVHNGNIFASSSLQNNEFSTQNDLFENFPSSLITENVQNAAELEFTADIPNTNSIMFGSGFDQSFPFDGDFY